MEHTVKHKLSDSSLSFSAVTEVKLLDCSNNQLTHVPASLSEMLALEQLYLRHNKLRLLPQLPAPALKVVTALTVFGVSHCVHIYFNTEILGLGTLNSFYALLWKSVTEQHHTFEFYKIIL